LQSWTGVRWGVSVVSGGGAPTVAEERDAKNLAAREKARDNPLVQAVFAAFPDARIVDVRTPAEARAAAGVAALPAADDDTGADWDPFEEE
ncbi:MAG: DNA polymerase III subunit gamma/tau, partial [Albidovulum sp.]